MDFSTILGELKSYQTSLDNRFSQLQRQVDGLEVKHARPGGGGGASSLLQELQGNANVAAVMAAHRGSVRFEISTKGLLGDLERKTISTAGVGGFSTHQVMPSERDTGIVAMPRPRLHMLDVIPSRPTTMGEIYWVTESVRPTKASPVTEYTGLKPLVEPTFSTDKEPVQTIAVLMLASNQVLADWEDLDGFLRNEGAARVSEELDAQLLSGDGNAPNLNGLTTQAQAWDLTLLTASDGYEYIDVLNGAMQQVAEDNELNGQQFVVLHPGDWFKIRRTKDGDGNYILGNPQTRVAQSLWDARVVATTQMTKGYFLVGSSDPQAAEYRNRQNLTVELSTEDSTNFRYNLVTIRFELRGALVVKRPNAFVYGQLTQSPA